MYTAKQLKILSFFKDAEWCSARDLGDQLGVSPVTVTRELGALIKASAVERRGKGRSTQYRIAAAFALLRPVNLDDYFRQDILERQVQTHFNFAIFDTLKTPLWTPEEQKALLQLQEEFSLQKSHLSQTLIRKEWERVTVEFSWKSSAIEGNTYSLLDTENLIKEGVEAPGKTKLESRMILNHKVALDFVREHAEEFRVLSRGLIESVHTLLVRDLGVTPNLRKTLVGIMGTNYRPLANEFQIKEVLDKTCELINAEENVFTKSLLSILLISYIQPFEDGNKRTARLIANAILNSHHCFPLSFRSTNEALYKKAILVFYEINGIAPMKDIFLDQCLFSVKTYFRSS